MKVRLHIIRVAHCNGTKSTIRCAFIHDSGQFLLNWGFLVNILRLSRHTILSYFYFSIGSGRLKVCLLSKLNKYPITTLLLCHTVTVSIFLYNKTACKSMVYINRYVTVIPIKITIYRKLILTWQMACC